MRLIGARTLFSPLSRSLLTRDDLKWYAQDQGDDKSGDKDGGAGGGVGRSRSQGKRKGTQVCDEQSLTNTTTGS